MLFVKFYFKIMSKGLIVCYKLILFLVFCLYFWCLLIEVEVLGLRMLLLWVCVLKVWGVVFLFGLKFFLVF